MDSDDDRDIVRDGDVSGDSEDEDMDEDVLSVAKQYLADTMAEEEYEETEYVAKMGGNSEEEDTESPLVPAQSSITDSLQQHIDNILNDDDDVPVEHMESNKPSKFDPASLEGEDLDKLHDEVELEADKARIVRELQNKNPRFVSLRIQAANTTLAETLLEFELEKLLQKKEDSLSQRNEALLSENHSSLSFPALNDEATEVDFRYFRRKREEHIARAKEIPQLNFSSSQSVNIQKKIKAAAEKHNTRKHMHESIKQFYMAREKNLKLQKYKLLVRYDKHVHNTEIMDKCEPLLMSRLRKIEDEIDVSLSRTAGLSVTGPDLGKNLLFIKDFHTYLRSTIYEYRTTKKLNIFYKKLKCIASSERYNLFRKAYQPHKHSRKESVAPLMIISLKRVETELEELKKCFDLTRITNDAGQEFLYAVGKRFSAVFNAQTEAMKFAPYPYQQREKTDPTPLSSRERKKVDQYVQPDVVYLKPATWIKHVKIKASVPLWQERQNIILENIPALDVPLSVESSFLNTSDLAYVNKRLKEQADNHIQRAFIRRNFNSTFTEEKPIDEKEKRELDTSNVEGGKSTITKITAVYLLRYIRIREFKKKLLDFLNYFASVERRLTLDQIGLQYADKDPSFLTQFYMDPLDLQEARGSQRILNRDDYMTMVNNRDLFVKDSFGAYIMYDSALAEMEKLDEKILRIGTVFISKNIDANNTAVNEEAVTVEKKLNETKEVQLDRLAVLEDLYESETWFHDSKRKIIDSYMEMYEHACDTALQLQIAQNIVDVIGQRPKIDFSSLYFTESYSSDVVTLELKHSLLKDILATQIAEEKKYLEYVHESIKPGEKQVVDSAGYPDKPIDDRRLCVPLFPNAGKIGVLDFYTSLGHAAYLHKVLDSTLDDVIDAFKVENALGISSLNRAILQQAIVEWKLLTKEEKIKQNIKTRIAEDRQSVEDMYLLEDPEDMISLVHALIAEEIPPKKRPDNSNFTNKENTRQTEGGYVISEKEAIEAQIFSNAIELVHIHRDLVDQLYETDILYNVYFEQAKLVGMDRKKAVLENMCFDSDGRNDDDLPSAERQEEVVALKTQFLVNLSISEFDTNMGDYNFDTHEGIKKVLLPANMAEFRQVYQFQCMQRALLEVVCKFNQTPADDYISNQNSSTFMTTLSNYNPYENNDSPMTQTKLAGLFLTLSSIQYPHWKRCYDEYHKVYDTLKKNKQASTMILKRRLRELKYKLAKQYVDEIIKSIYPYSLRNEIISVANDMRSVVQHLRGKPGDKPQLVRRGSKPEGGGFTLGEEDHQLQMTSRILNRKKEAEQSTGAHRKCMLAKDGQVVDALYIPHYIHVMKMQFFEQPTHNEEDHTGNDDQDAEMAAIANENPSIEHLGNILSILQCTHILLHFFRVHAQMPASSYTVVQKDRFGSEGVNDQARKLAAELDHLRQVDSATSVIYFLRKKCRLHFYKSILTMYQLQYKLSLLRDNGGKAFVQDTIDEMCEVGRFAPPTNPLLVRYGVPLPILKHFLFSLNDSQRNYYCAEEMNIELFLEDLLTEERIYATSHPEQATERQYEFLERSITLWSIRRYFFKMMIGDDAMHPLFDNDEKQEEYWNNNIVRRAKHVYDRDLRMQERMAEMNKEEADVTASKRKPRRRREKDFRDKQITVAVQELNKILMSNTIQQTKVHNALLRRKVTPEDQRDEKLEIFLQFLDTVMSNAVKSKGKNGEVTFSVAERDLTNAMDTVGHRIQQWKTSHISEITQACSTQLDQSRKTIFNLEQKLKLIEYKNEMDMKSFTRRVQSEVADKSYDLVFHVDMLQRQNDELQTKLENVHTDVKDELRIEYEDSVMKLTQELMMVKGKFAEYRQSLFKEMQKKFTEVKKDALIQIAQPTGVSNTNVSFKQKALKIVMEDNEANKLKKEAEEHKSFAQKLTVLNKLKLLSLRSKYEKRIREAEEERENAKKIYFGNKSKIEERENLLRQQLIKTQQLLSNMEMEVEQLRKDLQLQIKNKQKLVNWKVKNAQLLDELEVKVEKYERWNKVDVDKLLLELEKKKQELEAYTRTKTRENKKSDYVENKAQKEVEMLKKKLQKEKELKGKVLQKMEEMHQEKEHGHEAGTWQRKYFDAMADLQVATKEVGILKDHMDKAGIEEPSSPTNVYQDTSSEYSFATSSRPVSASASERPFSGGSSRRLFSKPSYVPNLNINRSNVPNSSVNTPTSTVQRMDYTSMKRPSTVDPTVQREDVSIGQRSQTSRSAGVGNQTMFANRPMTVVPGYQRVRSATPTSISRGINAQKLQSQAQPLSGTLRPRSAGAGTRKRPSTANIIVGNQNNLGGILGVIPPSSTVKRPSTATNY